MSLSFPVNHDTPHRRTEGSDPWGDLRRYEQAKADGTAPEASFEDFLDVINPLHHIPIVSTIYRELTGDTIQGASRIVGGGLYGGVGGFVGGLINAVTEEATGRDLGDHVMAAVGLSDDAPAEATTTQVAAAQTAAPTADQSAAGGDQTPTAAPASAVTTGATPAAAAIPAAAAQARQAGEDAQLAAGGALTGLAALRAFARDSSSAAAAAQADQATAARTAAEIQSRQHATAAPQAHAALAHAAQAHAAQSSAAHSSAAPAPGTPAGAPSHFMPLGDRALLTNPRARSNVAVLAAESDSLGHRRLQGDPRAVPNPRHVRAPEPPASTPSPAPGVSGPTASAPTAPAPTASGSVQYPTSAHPVGSGQPGAAAAQGDLAARMMRALNKYEAMRQAD